MFGKAQIFLGLLVFGALGASSFPVMAQSSRDISNRLDRIENEIETLGRAVYKGETPPAGAYQGSVNSADAEVRIQGFESEIRALTGKIEEQDYQIRQLREQLDKLTADIDMRLHDISGGGTPGSAQGSVGGFTNDPTPASGGMQYRDRSTEIPQPDAPQGSDTVSPTGYQWKSGSAAESGGQLGTLSESGAGSYSGSSDSATGLYESAFSLLKGAQYDEAEKEFKSFLSQYPDHALSGNATYWLGETYYVRGQFENAAKTFAEGYKKSPKGGKAADNLLKMGLSLSGMGNKSGACVALGQIEKEFAATAPAVLRRAKQEITRIGC
ncbi:MAG: tol-pal system protein YbgF [Alphaproteobacteria bacterium]